MIERLSHEPAPALAEDDGRSDWQQALELLRAHLSRTISEGFGQGSAAGQWGEIDNAEIAAFLDGSLSRAAWDAVAARLVNDPVARAELAAAAALLDEVQAEPVTAPTDLMGRAAGILAASEQNRPSVLAVTVASVAWYRRPIAWPGFALVALAIIAVPAVLSDPGDTFSRGIVAIPDPTKEKDARSCIDANEQARKPISDNMGAETPSKNDDPCAPKPTDAGKHERPVSAGSN